MEIIRTDIEGVVIIEPRVFRDARGYFFESFNQKDFDALLQQDRQDQLLRQDRQQTQPAPLQGRQVPQLQQTQPAQQQGRQEKQERSVRFVQDNESMSSYGVIRGLHFQAPPFAQSKLVRCVRGAVLDVAVDIRKGSPTYGRHVAVELTEDNHRMCFIPRGFAHGFSVLSETAVFQYKCDNFYAPQSEGGVSLADPALGIDWRIRPGEEILSAKDSDRCLLKDFDSPFVYGENLYPEI